MYSCISYLMFLITPCFCSHAQPNTSDVITTYAGHAEAVGNSGLVMLATEKPATALKVEKLHDRFSEGEQEPITDSPEPPRDVNDERDEVVFIPNEETRQIDDEGYLESERTVGDLFDGRRTLNDVMNRRNNFENTEAPQNPDVMFVTGKNNQFENTDDTNYRRSENKEVHREALAGRKIEGKKIEELKKIDCTNLDCNRTRQAVCGGKLDGHTWRYRLFLNECYLNKVNCGFKFDVNKYQLVPAEKCRMVAAHAPVDRRNKHLYLPPPPVPPVPQNEDLGVKARRALVGRRSQNLELNGNFCAHACPLSCPSEYAPECALSSEGTKKVFLNHCSLDLDSCTSNVAWQQRPLGECVGNKQAELRQNRAFIGWMQRAGIVDGKGRFVHE